MQKNVVVSKLGIVFAVWNAIFTVNKRLISLFTLTG